MPQYESSWSILMHSLDVADYRYVPVGYPYKMATHVHIQVILKLILFPYIPFDLIALLLYRTC